MNFLYSQVHWLSLRGQQSSAKGTYSGNQLTCTESQNYSYLSAYDNIIILLCIISYREVFMDFDPVLVSKLNEKKIVAPGSTAISLLSEPKLRAIIENAKQILKVCPCFAFLFRHCSLMWLLYSDLFRFKRVLLSILIAENKHGINLFGYFCLNINYNGTILLRTICGRQLCFFFSL